MSNFISNISPITEGKYANALLYAGVFAFMAMDFIPSPADAIYAEAEKTNREKWQQGLISPQDYYRKSLNTYYNFAQPAWWILGVGVIFFWDGDFKQKLTVAMATLATGAAVGFFFSKGLKKPEQLHKEVRAQMQVTEEALYMEGLAKRGKKKVYTLKKVHDWNL